MNFLRSLVSVVLIFIVALSIGGCSPMAFLSPKPYKETQFLMDTIIEITAYGSNNEVAVKAAFDEFKRIKLADRLVMDIEDFFPIIELASLLGFAKVVEGDIELTPEGIQFARATVLERKELFKDQLLKNVPFITQMINVLQTKSNKHMNIEFFEDLIARTFGDEVAKTQIQLIVSWGRYAELFGYDKVTELVYLESGI